MWVRAMKWAAIVTVVNVAAVTMDAYSVGQETLAPRAGFWWIALSCMIGNAYLAILSARMWARARERLLTERIAEEIAQAAHLAGPQAMPTTSMLIAIQKHRTLN